jgi:hypothetical protein
MHTTAFFTRMNSAADTELYRQLSRWRVLSKTVAIPDSRKLESWRYIRLNFAVMDTTLHECGIGEWA